MEHIVFLTGRLAEPALARVLAGISDAPFTWEIRNPGVQVAALMTADMIRRRLPAPIQADRMILPGRCHGDVDALSAHFGIPVERGPDELKDLPAYFNRRPVALDLTQPDLLIFAEIVDAPRLDPAEVLERARRLRADGADVIDLGCIPRTPFPALATVVRALKEEGFRVSVDSMDTGELKRGAQAGADYLFSLTLDTLPIAFDTDAVPVLVPREPGDEASLHAAIEAMQARGLAFLADPILDPLPFGFVASLCRYARLRERFPDAPILLGLGNLTELVEADTCGMNALLCGIAAELRAAAVLTTQVSPHARSVVREIDTARRVMRLARDMQMLPKGITDALMALHAKAPFPYDDAEIAATAAAVRDPGYRVQTSERGIHLYNRAGHHVGNDPFALYPKLQDVDASHAFYLGVELARAEIAWQLGKRYVQDRPLDWGCATDPAARSTRTDPCDAPAIRTMETNEK